MGTKNNPKNRGAAAETKTYGGKPIKPLRYIGTQEGHGKYIAAQYEDGSPVVDANGKPIPWKNI